MCFSRSAGSDRACAVTSVIFVRTPSTVSALIDFALPPGRRLAAALDTAAIAFRVTTPA
jgi:hypothetical protein